MLANPLFLIPILVGPIFMITGFIMLKFPPKTINSIYGYRTPASMKNQQRWNFAQQYSAKKMIEYGALYLLTALIGLFVRVRSEVATPIAIALMIVMIVLMFVNVETAIKRNFKD